MNHLNRVWMAATVAAVQGSHADQGTKWKSGLQALHHGKRRFFSGSADAADLRPLSAAVVSGRDVDEGLRQSDESMRRVMYLNCWGQG
ncbi:unnamed protein product [Linum tenue]|uniref:Wound-responsive family protein n=1 Tax=Linum tenue TaxID=586396 RepID=A0AAV0NQA6_9ROSI|nr:unnamed protein product [Linum tenue]